MFLKIGNESHFLISKWSYIDNADDAIEEHINFLTRKYLHEVWPLR